jgi:iron complex transport system substrate-binding protein
MAVFLKSAYRSLVSGFGLLVIGTFVISCRDQPKEKVVEEINFIRDTSIKYSERFAIGNLRRTNMRQTYKAIYLYGDRERKKETAIFVLYPRGEKKPDLIDAYYISVPVSNIACMSSVYAAMLTKLGLQDKIVAVDNADYYNNQFIINGVASQKIKEIGKGPQISVEQTLVLKPELLLMFGMGNPKKDADEKILNSGIPVAITLDHLEEHPLARAEWIKFIAAFFDKDKEADSLFKSTEQNYLQLKKLADTVKYKPTVLTEIKYADAWHVPGGNSFMAHFLKDAGADYIWKNENRFGSIALNFEEVYMKAKDADYWLNLFINVNSKKDLLAFDERYNLFKAFRNGNLYNNTRKVNSKGYSDYYENGLSNPDELLKDFIKILHPRLLPGHQLKYYKKID